MYLFQFEIEKPINYFYYINFFYFIYFNSTLYKFQFLFTLLQSFGKLILRKY